MVKRVASAPNIFFPGGPDTRDFEQQPLTAWKHCDLISDPEAKRSASSMEPQHDHAVPEVKGLEVCALVRARTQWSTVTVD